MFPVVFGVGMDKPLEFFAGRTPKVTKIDSEKCEICAELAGLGIGSSDNSDFDPISASTISSIACALAESRRVDVQRDLARFHKSGKFITTSAEVTLNGGFVRESSP